MSATLDTALTDRVASILAEITAVEASRPPIAEEVQAELVRLDALAARAAAAPPAAWLSPAPQFSPATFGDSVMAALMLIAPDKAREVVIEHTKRRCAMWTGLRLTASERERRLAKLAADLRVTRAKLEQRRRAIEQQSGTVLPRAGDDPSIWLLRDQPLAELAGTANDGRAK